MKCEPVYPERKHVLITYSSLAEDRWNVLSLADRARQEAEALGREGRRNEQSCVVRYVTTELGMGASSGTVGLILPTLPSEGKKTKGRIGNR